MADEKATPEPGVVVVPTAGEPVGEEPFVPKEPAPVEIQDGTSNTVLLEEEPPPADSGASQEPNELRQIGQEPNELRQIGQEPAAPGLVEVRDETSNTIILEEEPPKARDLEEQPPANGEAPGDGEVKVIELPTEPDPNPPEVPVDAGVKADELPTEPDPNPPEVPVDADVKADELPTEPAVKPDGLPTEPAVNPDAGPAAAHEAPVADTPDLPTDLFEAPPPFATGAAAGGVDGATDAAPVDTADTGEAPPGLEPIDEFEGTAPEPVEDLEDVVGAEDDADDPGFLEQVADTVGDLWDDVTDAVT